MQIVETTSSIEEAGVEDYYDDENGGGRPKIPHCTTATDSGGRSHRLETGGQAYTRTSTRKNKSIAALRRKSGQRAPIIAFEDRLRDDEPEE